MKRNHVGWKGAGQICVALWVLLQVTCGLRAQMPDSFNPGANADVYGVAVQANGNVVAWGSFTALGGQTHERVGRISPDGTVDEEFKASASDAVLAAAIQSDGRILVGGVFQALCGQGRNYFGRLTADGTLDESFNPNPNNYVYVVAVQADGRILVGGEFTQIAGQPRNHLARLNPDGSLDPNFNPAPDGYVYASLIEQGDGKILIGGEFLSVGGEGHTNIARLNPDGSIDSSFTAAVDHSAYRMAVQADGKILLGGNLTAVNGQPRRFIARLNADGTLDSGFDLGADMWVHSFAPQADGRILVGGEFLLFGGAARTNLARLNPDGTLDATFFTGTGGLYYPDVRCVALQSDGRLITAGWFGTLGGQSRANLGRLVNTDAATESLGFDGSTITWQRGGTSPELLRAVFSASTNGSGWVALGEGQRVAGGWQRAGISLPASATIRARGYVAGGDGGSSGWFRESFSGPPAVATQPASRTNDAGTVARFTIYAGGSGPLSYQWRKGDTALADGTNIAGAQTGSLVIGSVFGADAGGYSVVITNAQGSVTSIVATLTVRDPVITAQPASRTNDAGTIAAFSVGAVGTVPLNYQWQKGGAPLADGGNVAGATTSGLTLTNVLGGDGGDYAVVVTTSYGSVTSAVATLAVTDPVINTQPASRAVNAGRTASFSVKATGTAPVYQWRKSGANLDGATATSLTISNAQGPDIGGYDVVVRTAFGSVTSAVANLSVNLALPDAFNPVVNGPVYALALQRDGKVLLGGQFTTAGGAAHWGIARLEPGGAVDGLFTPQISRFAPGGTPYVKALAVQPDGRIVVGGSFYMLGGAARNSLGRLNPDGTADPVFSPSPNGTVLALALQPDGKLLVGGSFTSLYGQPRARLGRINADGSLDTNFNSVVNNTVNTIALQPDGKILLGGSFTQAATQSRNYLARLNPNGTIDAGFNPGPNAAVTCVVAQPDGRVLVAGSFTTLAAQTRNYLGRLNANGSLDPSFNPGPNGPVNSLALQADGKIIVAGQFSTVAGKGRNDLCRLNPDGTADASFFPVGSDNLSVGAVAVDDLGRVLLGNDSFLLVGGETRSNFCRLNATGPATQSLSFDGSTLTWLRDGTGPEISGAEFLASTNGGEWIDLGSGMRISNGWQLPNLGWPANATVRAQGYSTGGQQDGSTWVVESSVGPAAVVTEPVSRTNIAATTAVFSVEASGTGTLSYRWHREGQPLADRTFITGSASPTLVLSNVLGGDAGGYSVVISNSSGSVTSRVAQLTVIDPFLTGQPTSLLVNAGQPASFIVVVAGTNPAYQWRKDGTNLAGANASTLALGSVSWDDRGSYDVVVSNAFGCVTSSVAALSVNLAVPDAFNPGANSYAFGLAVQTDGKILVGGGFSTLGGQSCFRLGRLNADGSFDAGFNAGADSSSWLVHCLAVQTDGQILVGGEFSTLAGQTRVNLARLNPDGSLEAGFNPGAGGTYVNCLAVQPDGQIVAGGEFTSLGGQPRSNLGRITPAGAADTNFVVGADRIVCASALMNDGGVAVGGYFSLLGGQSRSGIGRVTPTGALDLAFDPFASGTVYCLAAQPDGKVLVGGYFTALGGKPRGFIGRLNADGTVDDHFNPNANGTVYSFALQSDGKILIGGDFTQVGGESRNRLARLNADGTLDPVFNPGANGSVTALALQPDGHVLAGGNFSLLAGQARSCLGRLANTEAATQRLACDGWSVTWLRGGTSPEVWRTTFEVSADGTNWSVLGSGTRIPGGWRLAGLSVPATSFIRARGFITGGQFNGSGWLVENTLQVSAASPPRILVDDGNFGVHSGAFGFNLAGIGGQTVAVETSTDLAHWTAVSTNTFGGGLVYFSDPGWTNDPGRFYRLRVW